MISREHITSELQRIEREHQVRVLYACESGSRAWGFESVDSDYDVRFIFARQPAEYLRFTTPRDVIEEMPGDALDLAGWDRAARAVTIARGARAVLPRITTRTPRF